MTGLPRQTTFTKICAKPTSVSALHHLESRHFANGAEHRLKKPIHPIEARASPKDISVKLTFQLKNRQQDRPTKTSPVEWPNKEGSYRPLMDLPEKYEPWPAASMASSSYQSSQNVSSKTSRFR